MMMAIIPTVTKLSLVLQEEALNVSTLKVSVSMTLRDLDLVTDSGPYSASLMENLAIKQEDVADICGVEVKVTGREIAGVKPTRSSLNSLRDISKTDSLTQLTTQEVPALSWR